MDLGERAPLGMEEPRHLDGRSRLAEQDGMAGEATDTIHGTGGGTRVDARRRGHRTIATNTISLPGCGPNPGEPTGQEPGVRLIATSHASCPW